MTEPAKERIVICCERMLIELGVTVHLDDDQWPHLDDSITGPMLGFCPWCRAELPFKTLHE